MSAYTPKYLTFLKVPGRVTDFFVPEFERNVTDALHAKYCCLTSVAVWDMERAKKRSVDPKTGKRKQWERHLIWGHGANFLSDNLITENYRPGHTKLLRIGTICGYWTAALFLFDDVLEWCAGHRKPEDVRTAQDIIDSLGDEQGAKP